MQVVQDNRTGLQKVDRDVGRSYEPILAGVVSVYMRGYLWKAPCGFPGFPGFPELVSSRCVAVAEMMGDAVHYAAFRIENNLDA